MTLSIYTVHVSCFPASEYGDVFIVVAQSEESALKSVATKYAENAYGEDGDHCGRDKYETLHSWWKNPYTNRAGYKTGVKIIQGESLHVLQDGNVLSAVFS